MRSIQVVAFAAVNSFSLFYNISTEGTYSHLVFILLLMVTELFPFWVIAKITAINTNMSFAHTCGAYFHVFLAGVSI